MATDPWGVDDGYWDVLGSWHPTSPEIASALRKSMGAEDDQPSPPSGRPVWVVYSGDPAPLQDPCELILEDGARLQATDYLPPDLPIGYHQLRPPQGPSTHLIVSPGRCYLPDDLHAWALVAQLYACRSRASWGIGDFGDLRQLANWAASRGAGMVALNPLHAPVPTARVQPNPYFSSSRRWLNPLHLEIERLPGATEDPEVARLALEARSLCEDRRIDHDRVWRLKRAALERLWDRLGPDLRLERWRAEQGAPLETYARFCVLAEHYDSGWSSWPAEHRHPSRPEVSKFAAAHTDRVLFWAWIQMLAQDQLHRASKIVPFLHDLAIGVDPDGADAWAHQDLLALGTQVGAPPDRFNSAGQEWGTPPFVPWKLRDAGYAPLAELWRSALSNGAGLRIDHVMGLFRLYWVPPGYDARNGAYVRYHGDELLAVLAIESTRAGALVVGEDLGTVEEEVREALGRARVLSNRLVWFEDRPPEEFPRRALSAVTTHDLPTVVGEWSGADAAEQRTLGRDADAEQSVQLRARLAELSGCEPDAPVEDVILAVHDRLARTPSMLVAATMEDACAVPERPNMPGTTTDQRPNWSLALPHPLEDMLASPLPRKLAEVMRAGRTPSLTTHPPE